MREIKVTVSQTFVVTVEDDEDHAVHIAKNSVNAYLNGRQTWGITAGLRNLDWVELSSD